VKSGHDDIVKLGLHAVRPGTTDNVIIAKITPSKIGKKSSAADLENWRKTNQSLLVSPRTRHSIY
jgi:hypothetical protein